MHNSDYSSLFGYTEEGNEKYNIIEKNIYSLFKPDTTFMRRHNHINYAGNMNVLAGYSLEHELTYPHPYPMIGITDNISEIYRYLVTFSPFAHLSNKSNFLYLPLMFGASMLKHGFASSGGSDSRKKCLILIDNMGDLFAPHELTYLGLSNDASCLTLVNGDKLDYENGELKFVDGYYRNKIYAQERISLIFMVFRMYAPERSLLYSLASVFIEPFFGILLFMVRNRRRYSREDFIRERAEFTTYDPFGTPHNNYNNNNQNFNKKVEDPFPEFSEKKDDNKSDDYFS
jgi:hypothetical protein